MKIRLINNAEIKKISDTNDKQIEKIDKEKKAVNIIFIIWESILFLIMIYLFIISF